MENSSNSPPRYTHLPGAAAPEDVERCLSEWGNRTAELTKQEKTAALANWMQMAAQTTSPQRAMLEVVFGNSPYLARLLLLFPQILKDLAEHGADSTHNTIMQELLLSGTALEDHTDLKRRLRLIKSKMALLIAMADIGGLWSLEQVTHTLSLLAETSLSLAVNTILRTAHRLGEIVLLHPENPSLESGIVILGMGKLGGYELNYSSDIDLIIFYEPGKLGYKGRHTEQKFMNRLAHEIVTIMQERTPQGYVFRTDLRLRPDPASTPPAITTDAAYYYYESVGQNWERAAMIKARPVAGDISAGERFLKGILPFMWRRNLDFAAINDIHSIKRQMDSARGKTIQLAGHNIKLGVGGIREIEFYVQIHQLIWGGREAVLRTRATCDTLRKLAQFGLVSEDKKDALIESYAFLRKLEHRLQMVGDEQTHSLPENPEKLAHIACFMGYNNLQSFETALLDVLHLVHGIYASSFNNAGDSESNLGSSGNLVFTGTAHDPETLETLRAMGYSSPETVSEIVMGWHHGSRRSTRTKRARELLTELMPRLLASLANTVNLDSAFLKFNDFLFNLPAGVQVFSLFSANPQLLQLIADIMGSAPTLADTLSKNPSLLDAVLYEDFYGPLPSTVELSKQLGDTLSIPMPLGADVFEEHMNRLRYFRGEKHFQAGVQLLRHMITAQQAGVFLSYLADILIQKTLDLVMAEFVKTYGSIEGSHFTIIGLGKLGSREMTVSSDIDLVFVYDVPDFDNMSDGDKNFGPSVYFNRLSQRFLSALTTMGHGGRLYEVDTRLRPSGVQGLLAVSTKALTHYFEELAWTFEYMAFTKARVINNGAVMHATLEPFIHAQLTKPRDVKKLFSDAIDMRSRIAKEHGGNDPWDIKFARGGLMDIDFIAQALLLRHAPEHPDAQPGAASNILSWLAANRCIPVATAAALIASEYFLSQLFHVLRLCSSRKFDETTAPQGLKKILVDCVKEKDFESLKARLIQVEQLVSEQYIALLQYS